MCGWYVACLYYKNNTHTNRQNSPFLQHRNKAESSRTFPPRAPTLIMLILSSVAWGANKYSSQRLPSGCVQTMTRWKCRAEQMRIPPWVQALNRGGTPRETKTSWTLARRGPIHELNSKSKNEPQTPQHLRLHQPITGWRMGWNLILFIQLFFPVASAATQGFHSLCQAAGAITNSVRMSGSAKMKWPPTDENVLLNLLVCCPTFHTCAAVLQG